MAFVRIANVGAAGVIKDIPAHELPPEVWSDAQNVRFREGKIVRSRGHKSVFETVQVAPYSLFPAPIGEDYYWVYCGLAKVYAFQGGVHTDITRSTGGDYSATVSIPWTGGMLTGVLVLNNGIDPPQQWNTTGSSQVLRNLDNWPADVTCRVLRPFKNYLVAADITDSGGTRFPHLVRWSHQADPGTVPSSWEINDAAVDAGSSPVLSDTEGHMLDMLPLLDTNIIYKQDATWGMQLIGGTFIFRFFKIFSQIGMLTRRCVTQLPQGNKHFVVTSEDVIIHDGRIAESVIDRKMRKWLFNVIDTTNIERSFSVANYSENEIWFCFPEQGEGFATLALIWNYREDSYAIRDLPPTVHAGFGKIILEEGEIWDDTDETWDSKQEVWGLNQFAGEQRKILIAGTNDTKLFHADQGNQFDGTNFLAFVERTDWAIAGQDYKGNIKMDAQSMKLFKGVWIRATGGPFQVRLGAQQVLGGAVTWQPPQTFTPGVSEKVDFHGSGRALAIRIESEGDVHWEIEALDIDVELLGRF